MLNYKRKRTGLSGGMYRRSPARAGEGAPWHSRLAEAAGRVGILHRGVQAGGPAFQSEKRDQHVQRLITREVLSMV